MVSWNAREYKGVPGSAQECQRVQVVSFYLGNAGEYLESFLECQGVPESAKECQRLQAVSFEFWSAGECLEVCQGVPEII